MAGPDGEVVSEETIAGKVFDLIGQGVDVGPGKVQESHDGPSRFLLLEAVADVLDHPQELVFATSVFPEASLRMVEDAPGLRQMVQTSVNHPFPGLHDAGGEADGSVRLDRARWFPCLQQRMVAFRQACGTSDSWSDWLKIPSNSPLARGPKAFRKLGGGMSPGPAAPFFLIFLMALFSSSMLNSAVELSSTLWALPLILTSLFFSLSSLENSSLLTLA